MYKNKQIYDVAVVGTGSAGIACAIQLKRYGINPIIFEKNKPGGLLRNANFVENYPGYAEGISGLELAEKFNNQLKKINLSPVFEKVIKVNFNNEIFEIKTEKSFYTSKILVAASGTTPEKLKIQTDKNLNNCIFYEICEFYKYETRNKKVVIVGSGDAAFDYALNIVSNTKASQVIILNRSSKTKCINLLKERAAENNKITYIENEEPVKLENISGKINIVCKNREIESDYLLAAIGRVPDIDFLDKNLLDNSAKPENNKKLFFIGDVKNDIFRQTAIATGDGIKAAMEIYRNFYNT